MFVSGVCQLYLYFVAFGRRQSLRVRAFTFLRCIASLLFVSFLKWPPHCSHISSQCPPITALSKLICLMLDNGVPGSMICFVRMIAEVIKILALTQNSITSLAQLKGMGLEFIHFPADTPGVCIVLPAQAGWHVALRLRIRCPQGIGFAGT